MKRWFAALVVVATLIFPAGSAAADGVAPGLSIPWRDCTGPAQRGFECASLRVPLDYERPHGRQIDLALIRHRATDPGRRVGTIFYEPGGPGVGGTEFLPALAYDGFPAPLRERFDIVSWDPRGVGESTSERCFADQKAEDRFFAGSTTRNVEGFPVGPAQVKTWIDRYREFGQRCQQRNRSLLTHVSTSTPSATWT